MALRKDDIPNCDDINDTFITKSNIISKSTLNKQSESPIHSPVTRENNCSNKSGPQENVKVKSEPSSNNFSTGDQSSKYYENTTEIVRSSREEYHPAHELEENSAHNHNVAIKEESSALSGESLGSSQPDILTPIFSQTISNISPISIKYEADYKFNSGEDLHLSSSCKSDYASPPAPSKQKLRNTKRRAGILYRQITSSKLSKNTSKYFSQAHTNNKNRWIPPRSPYALVQEDLFDNPWQLLVATIFLTKTSAKKALPQLHKFLACYPRPEDVLKANYEDIDEYFKPLGLTTTRSHIIMRFTVEFLEKDWSYPRELYGIGKYGDDSYRMFCINEWRQVSPDDIPLSMYRNWLLENAHRLGLE